MAAGLSCRIIVGFNSSAARFEGEYDELGETAPDVPSIPSVSVPDNPGILREAQPGTTTTIDVDLEGGEPRIWAKRRIFVDLNAIMGETNKFEAPEPHGGGNGCPKIDFLWKNVTNFELAEDSEDLVEDLPDLAEIVDPKRFSSERKGAGVVDIETKGPGTPQNAPNVEIVEVFEPRGKFASIPVTHEIGTAGEVKIGQYMFNILGKANERTLGPTKHPPGHAATYLNDNSTLLYQYKQVMVVTVSIQVISGLEDNQRTTLSLSGQWTTLSLSNERRKVCSIAKREVPPRLIVDQRHVSRATGTGTRLVSV